MEQELNFKPAQLKGEITVTLANGQLLDDFCVDHIIDYNRERFEAFALRVLVGRETILTIYAADKSRPGYDPLSTDKIAVKKFKISTLPVSELFSYCEGFNCTVSTGSYNLAELEGIK